MPIRTGLCLYEMNPWASGKFRPIDLRADPRRARFETAEKGRSGYALRSAFRDRGTVRKTWSQKGVETPYP